MRKMISGAFFIVLGGVFFTLLFAVPIEKMVVLACDDTDTECINSQIDKLEKKLEDASKKQDVLQQNLNQINSSLTATQQIILRTQVLLNQTTQTIDQKEQEIANLEQQLTLEKGILKGLIQEIYFTGETPLPEVILSVNDVKNFFQGSDNLLSTQEKMQEVIGDINDMKAKVADEKASLEDVKKDREQLLVLKNQQKQNLVATKIDVQDDLENQQATISELKSKLQKLRGDLSALLGENLSTDDIVKAAGIAAKATGVRKDFILGELVQETNLGRFTGGCYYKNTRMRTADKNVFKIIMKDLGYDLNAKKVSCSPGYGYGGAMGVAQFMPTTWGGADGKHGYIPTIASMTGHNPPNPWNIVDGVVGMAKKLANGGATSKSGERLAAKRYYCGGPSSPYWKTKCESYASNVLYWANNYESKL